MSLFNWLCERVAGGNTDHNEILPLVGSSEGAMTMGRHWMLERVRLGSP